MPGNMEYFCIKCGKQLLEDERPCSNCGCTMRYVTHKIYDAVNVVVNVTPSIDLILFTTIAPRLSKSSVSILAIKSYAPKRGCNSTISCTLENSLYTSCSCV